MLRECYGSAMAVTHVPLPPLPPPFKGAAWQCRVAAEGGAHGWCSPTSKRVRGTLAGVDRASATIAAPEEA